MNTEYIYRQFGQNIFVKVGNTVKRPSLISGMAVADIALIIEYLPFLVYTSFLPTKELSWGWAVYMWFHSNFSVVIHNVSVWLTLTVAVWRFIMVKYHTLVPVYCTMERCHWVLFSAYGKSGNIKKYLRIVECDYSYFIHFLPRYTLCNTNC